MLLIVGYEEENWLVLDEWRKQTRRVRVVNLFESKDELVEDARIGGREDEEATE